MSKKKANKLNHTSEFSNSYIISRNEKKHRQKMGVCIKCGATDLFSNTKLCWECYKADLQAEFD